jgi:hypothetical protein
MYRAESGTSRLLLREKRRRKAALVVIGGRTDEERWFRGKTPWRKRGK